VPENPAAKEGASRFAKIRALGAAVLAFFRKTAGRIRGKRRVSDSRPRAQGELALEKVTVLRNDLSDADLVVVAVQPKAAEPRGAGNQAPEPAGNPWTRVTARWIKLKNPESATTEARTGNPADRAQTPC
jgi:hypothetical protein